RLCACSALSRRELSAAQASAPPRHKRGRHRHDAVEAWHGRVREVVASLELSLNVGGAAREMLFPAHIPTRPPTFLVRSGSKRVPWCAAVLTLVMIANATAAEDRETCQKEKVKLRLPPAQP